MTEQDIQQWYAETCASIEDHLDCAWNSYRAAAYAVKALQQQRQGAIGAVVDLERQLEFLQTELTEHQIDKLQNLMAGLQSFNDCARKALAKHMWIRKKRE